MARRRKATLDDVVSELKKTQHCLAVLVAQVARTQSGKREFLIDSLDPLGLRARDIAKILGTTEAAVGATRSRQRKAAAAPSLDKPPADPPRAEP